MIIPEPTEALNKCCSKWSLTCPELVSESPLAILYKAVLPNGRLAMLKIFTPHGLIDEWDGAKLLQWYAGKGAVEVLGLADGALLMAHLGGDSLMDFFIDSHSNEAALIAADLVTKARHQPGPPPHLITINQRFEFLFRFPIEKVPDGSLLPFQKASGVARQMLAEQVSYVPLHGDLHFRNVMHDGEQWRLIDPKGLLGPPAYDLANLFINPWDRPDIVLAPGRAENLAKALSDHTGHSESDLIGWAIAHAALAAAWSISNGGSGRHPLTALAYLLETDIGV